MNETKPFIEKKDFSVKRTHIVSEIKPEMTIGEIQNLLDNIKKPSIYETIKLLINQSEFVLKFIYYFLKLITGLKMNNDKKTTILGFVKSILIALITIFFADKISQYTGIVDLAIMAIGAIWALIEAIMGFYTNKEKK